MAKKAAPKKAPSKRAPAKIVAKRPQATRLEAIRIPPGWKLDGAVTGSFRAPAAMQKTAGFDLLPALTFDLDNDGLSYGFTLSKLRLSAAKPKATCVIDIPARVIASGEGLDLHLALIELDNAILRAKEHG